MINTKYIENLLAADYKNLVIICEFSESDFEYVFKEITKFLTNDLSIDGINQADKDNLQYALKSLKIKRAIYADSIAKLSEAYELKYYELIKNLSLKGCFSIGKKLYHFDKKLEIEDSTYMKMSVNEQRKFVYMLITNNVELWLNKTHISEITGNKRNN